MSSTSASTLVVDRERQAHEHAARVGLDRLVDELADVGEGGDLVEALLDLLRATARGSTALRKTFSRPVNSGLKPLPSSSSAATRPLHLDLARRSARACRR